MHRSPRLNFFGRRLLVEHLLGQGWSAATAAEAAGVSRATVYKWLRCYREQGEQGLHDRSSRPHVVHQLRPEHEGAHPPAPPRSQARPTVWPLSPATPAQPATGSCFATAYIVSTGSIGPQGRRIRRYEYQAPGELVHVDVKKLGRTPDGGGHLVHGRQARPARKRGLGYDYVHSMVDDHSRLAYSEILPDEKVSSCPAFLRPAGQFFADHGIATQRVMTDNAFAYRHGADFQAALAELGARRKLIPPYRPQVNGKFERFNRTLLEEWAYVSPYTCNQERVDLLQDWLHMHNCHRAHTARGAPAHRTCQ